MSVWTRINLLLVRLDHIHEEQELNAWGMYYVVDQLPERFFFKGGSIWNILWKIICKSELKFNNNKEQDDVNVSIRIIINMKPQINEKQSIMRKNCPR